ncbi:hypothetical protein CBR_g3253 [Chara braunii]|uniref:Threonine/serine exporter-like N-terminal domain-containing protein n=1 Tax=Chara braunii TaxID=69332 RepID=A0A388KFA5_CHABU|nr:hypothetical protein CBR_g3253 [Chara braunii]|eukprot:GBG68711.1 hypothetical protein CBR_g3253 [Chara braunii]
MDGTSQSSSSMAVCSGAGRCPHCLPGPCFFGETAVSAAAAAAADPSSSDSSQLPELQGPIDQPPQRDLPYLRGDETAPSTPPSTPCLIHSGAHHCAEWRLCTSGLLPPSSGAAVNHTTERPPNFNGQDLEERNMMGFIFRRRRRSDAVKLSMDDDDVARKLRSPSDGQGPNCEPGHVRDAEGHHGASLPGPPPAPPPHPPSSSSLPVNLLPAAANFLGPPSVKEPKSPPPTATTGGDAVTVTATGCESLRCDPMAGLQGEGCIWGGGPHSHSSTASSIAPTPRPIATPRPTPRTSRVGTDMLAGALALNASLAHYACRQTPLFSRTPHSVSRMTPVQEPGGPCPPSAVRPSILSNLSSEEEFLLVLLKALSSYGAPSHRMEYNLHFVSEYLGVDSCFAISPNIAWVSFGPTASHPNLRLFLIPLQQGFELAKLEDVNHICNELFQSRITLAQAMERVAKIVAATPAHPVLTQVVEVLSYAVIGWSICLAGFSGTWFDSALSFLAGFLCGVLCYLASVFSLQYMHLLEFGAAMLISCVVRIFQKFLAPRICVDLILVTFSGIVVLLPGLSLTLAIMELTSKNIVSGTVRLFHAILIAIFLGFGVVIGTDLGSAIAAHFWNPDHSAMAGTTTNGTSDRKPLSASPPPSSPPASSTSSETKICSYQRNPIPVFWLFVIFPVLSISISISFKSKLSQWFPTMVVSAAGYTVTIVLSPHLGMEATITIAAFVIALGSNVYSRITRRLGVAPVLGGILLLVPGSIGVRGTLSFLIENDVLSATNFAFQMMLVAVAITVGVFLGSMLVFPVARSGQRFLMML